MRLLYDGWSLVHDPVSPASLHLLSILENLPREIEPVLALPEPAPGWLDVVSTEIIPTPNTPWGRLRWEQTRLPSLAKSLHADFLHLTSPGAPSLSRQTTVFSPTGFGAGTAGWSGVQQDSGSSNHILDRLRTSLGLGGLAGVSGTLWPADLPEPELPGSLKALSPFLPSDFSLGVDQLSNKPGELQLPDEYILYHGPGDQKSIDLLAQAWNWAAGAVGENYPLLLVGLDDNVRRVVSGMSEILDFGDSLQILPDVLPPNLPQVYWLSKAVFHPAPASPWCGPVRLAIASGKPLVSVENKITGAIAGPAAYLVAENDARALGAALVTTVVEQELAESLSAAAQQKSQGWITGDIGDQLLGLYLAAGRVGSMG